MIHAAETAPWPQSDFWRSARKAAAYPSEIVAALQSRTNVFIHGAAATPTPLVEAMARRRDLEDVRLYHLHTAGPAPFAEPGRGREFLSNSLFVGAPLRQAIASGQADYVPVFLSDIPGLWAPRPMRPRRRPTRPGC
jgi:acyl-CoA hydrolase